MECNSIKKKTSDFRWKKIFSADKNKKEISENILYAHSVRSKKNCQKKSGSKWKETVLSIPADTSLWCLLDQWWWICEQRMICFSIQHSYRQQISSSACFVLNRINTNLWTKEHTHTLLWSQETLTPNEIHFQWELLAKSHNPSLKYEMCCLNESLFPFGNCSHSITHTHSAEKQCWRIERKIHQMSLSLTLPQT